MIDLKTVENIHNILVEKFGGTEGIRDLGGSLYSLHLLCVTRVVKLFAPFKFYGKSP